MHSISKSGVITLVQGDTFEFPIFIDMYNGFIQYRYILAEGEKIYFSVMEPGQDFDKGLIRKVYTTDDQNELGDVVIRLETQDTMYVMPGEYYYEVKISKWEGTQLIVDTIIPKKKFFIVQ